MDAGSYGDRHRRSDHQIGEASASGLKFGMEGVTKRSQMGAVSQADDSLSRKWRFTQLPEEMRDFYEVIYRESGSLDEVHGMSANRFTVCSGHDGVLLWRQRQTYVII